MASTATGSQADPDPTTQIAWPSSRKAFPNGDDEPLSPVDQPRQVLQIPHVRFGGSQQRSTTPEPAAEPGKRSLTTWDFIFLSVSMLGAQITWSVELG